MNNNKALTQSEIDILNFHRMDKTMAEIGRLLGRPKQTLSGYCKRNGLEYKHKRIALSQYQKDFIERWRMEKTILEMAIIIEVKVPTVRSYLFNNGLDYKRGTKKKHILTAEQQTYIRDNYSKMTYQTIGLHLGIKANTIGSYCHRNGLKKVTTEKKKRVFDREVRPYTRSDTPYEAPKDIEPGTRLARIHQPIKKYNFLTSSI